VVADGGVLSISLSSKPFSSSRSAHHVMCMVREEKGRLGNYFNGPISLKCRGFYNKMEVNETKMPAKGWNGVLTHFLNNFRESKMYTRSPV